MLRNGLTADEFDCLQVVLSRSQPSAVAASSNASTVRSRLLALVAELEAAEATSSNPSPTDAPANAGGTTPATRDVTLGNGGQPPQTLPLSQRTPSIAVAGESRHVDALRDQLSFMERTGDEGSKKAYLSLTSEDAALARSFFSAFDELRLDLLEPNGRVTRELEAKFDVALSARVRPLALLEVRSSPAFRQTSTHPMQPSTAAALSPTGGSGRTAATTNHFVEEARLRIAQREIATEWRVAFRRAADEDAEFVNDTLQEFSRQWTLAEKWPTAASSPSSRPPFESDSGRGGGAFFALGASAAIVRFSLRVSEHRKLLAQLVAMLPPQPVNYLSSGSGSGAVDPPRDGGGGGGSSPSSASSPLQQITQTRFFVAEENSNDAALQTYLYRSPLVRRRMGVVTRLEFQFDTPRRSSVLTGDGATAEPPGGYPSPTSAAAGHRHAQQPPPGQSPSSQRLVASGPGASWASSSSERHTAAGLLSTPPSYPGTAGGSALRRQPFDGRGFDNSPSVTGAPSVGLTHEYSRDVRRQAVASYWTTS